MESTNYTANCLIEFVRKIFNQWDGKITETDKVIKIVSNNDLGGRKVECEISVGYMNKIGRAHV